MNKLKITLVILFISYILTAIVSYVLGIEGLLFSLSLPWGMIPLILSVMTHSFPDNYWFLVGSLLNPTILLWFVVVRPAINKTGEISE